MTRREGNALVRMWLAARLVDYVDHAYALLHPFANAVWDEYTRRHGDLQFGSNGAGVLSLHLLKVCPTCEAHVNAPCLTVEGRKTTPHKARREVTS